MLGIRKIIGAYSGRLTLRLPFFSRIGEIADVFLFLRIHRDDGLILVLKGFDSFVDKVKLLISIGMICTF